MTIKRGVTKCRSGYDPMQSDYKQIEKGETPDHKKRVFSFPKNKQVRDLWIKAIRRDDLKNTGSTGICEKHFKPSDFLSNLTPRINKERQRYRLKPNAVPSIVDSSSYADACRTDTPRPTKLATTSARRSHEMKLLQSQVNEFERQDSVIDVSGLYNKLLKERLPSGFRLVLKEHNRRPLLSIITEDVDDETGLLSIAHTVSIFEDMSFKMYHQGVLLSNKEVADIAKSGQLQTVSQVLNVLARLKTLFAGTASRLNAAAQLLEEICTDPRSEVCVQPLVTFVIEQLRLVTKQSNGRRFSSALLGNAVVWDRSSPKLYDQLQQSALFCLPHSKTLRRLTSALHMGAGLDEATMDYLRMRGEALVPRDRLVNIAMDEVYTSQAAEMTGGRVYGMGDTAGEVTKTLFCTHINSVAGSYQDMVSMTPVPHVTKEEVKTIFYKVLKGLTELGFKVVSVTTDNHRVNQSFHKSLGPDGSHPEFILNPYAEDEERIFTMYDTVHVFKNMYYGLMKQRTLNIPAFTDSKEHYPLKVDFRHLEQVFNMERGNPTKLAHKLTDKALHPSNLERVNVKLAAAVNP